MRKAAVAILVLLSTPAIAGRGLETTFAPPGQLSGDVEIDGAQWVSIFFRDGSGSFEVDLPRPAEATNFTYVSAAWAFDPLGSQSVPAEEPPSDSVLPESFEFQFSHVKPVGSIILEADNIRVQAASVSAMQVQGQPSGSPMAAHVPPEIFQSNPYWDWNIELNGPNVIAISRQSEMQGFRVVANGLRSLHWFGSTISCPAAPCPDGGGARTLQRLDFGEEFRVAEFSYGFAGVGDGRLEGAGRGATLLVGGHKLDMKAVGAVRLPLASAVKACDNCHAVDEQTLHATGSLLLENTTLDGEGFIRTELAGSFVSSRLDEAAVKPDLLFGRNVAASAVATAGLLALLKWLIAPFFTRLSKEQALEHPRRKQIFDYIQHNPGANFREIARNTGIAAGTVRHHLNVMTRSDIVVEHQHGSTVRLFENVSRFQSTANWADHVLLREPALGELYEWLKANPGSPQKAVLEGMEPEDWSRSTTQHRLARLVDGGLATIRLQGRLKIYTAVDRSAKPPPPPATSSRTSANPA